MPMMNGYEAAKQIRAMKAPFCRQIPVIAMTANAFEEDKALALQAELDIYRSDMHAFDMLRPEEPLSRLAAERFNRHFAYAKEHFFAENG